MDTEDTGSGKEDEPEQEVTSEQEEDDGAGPSTSSGSNPQSSNRHMRNMAEKMRRDKLNFFINELSSLVPIISYSPKKLDKTSILRLAATYIRLNNVICGSPRRDSRRSSNLDRQMINLLPHCLGSFNWSENVLEEMDGMLLIVNGAGRIIFISSTVEKLLGHTQIELMGQLLYNVTCLEDYDELRKNLTPDEELANATPHGESAADESSSDSSTTPATPPCRQIMQASPTDSDQRLRRSFYIRLRQRAQSRSDQPQYELVHVVGHLRVPPRKPQPSTSHQTPNLNEVILVAVVKPFKEKRITTLSLMEACREEFITRHTLDGRIIYTDHRISIVAGYLSEEVCGVPGFQYMHKEDMRWTMVGLRQMFFRGSSYGQSCYRLQSKNGTFIYLKTCGYLELSENNDSFQSLICINSLVSQAEGEALIRQMKDQYSPVIKNKCDKNMEILSSNIVIEANHNNKGETEDPKVLEAAINQMISNVPPAPDTSLLRSAPSLPLPSLSAEPLFAKATLAAKAMPPLSIHVKKIGIVPPIIRTPAAVAASLSPPSSQHSPPLKASPPPPLPICPQQNRPSVLRVAHKQGDHVVPPPDRVSVLKIKRMRTDESGQEIITVSPSPAAPASTPSRSVGVLVSPSGASSGTKRKIEDTSDWPTTSVNPIASSQPSISLEQPPPLSPHFQLESVDQLLTSVDGPLFFDDASPPPLSTTHLEDIGLTDMYGLALSWGQPEVPEILETSHRTLDSRIQLQGDQIHEIEQELVMVPQDHTNGQVINTKLTQLQEEHRKQQQMLRTLQQDHQNIQHLGVCNNQQNVGV